MSEFTAGTLRELRISAGLSQKELGRRSGIHWTSIWRIEQGKTKPRELTWRRLLKALSTDSAGGEQPSERKEPTSGFFGEVLGRDEFFRRLKEKMSRALNIFFNESLISMLVDNAEFFSRQRYYPGDFATAVEVLGALLKAQRTLVGIQERKGQSNAYKRRAHGQENG